MERYKAHVHDDGDIEVTIIPETEKTDDLTFTTKEALIKELMEYGCDILAIKRSFRELLLVGDSTTVK